MSSTSAEKRKWRKSSSFNLITICDCELDERALDRLDAEWLFLTEKLEWKKGLPEVSNSSNAQCSEGGTMLAEYLFVSEQMGWKKGLKIFQEQGEIAIEKELKQIHDMEGFQPKHWFELTEKERASALKYLMYLKKKRDRLIKDVGVLMEDPRDCTP